MGPQPFEPGPHSHLFMLWYFWPNHWLRKHMPIWQPSVFTQYPRWSYFVFDQKSISKTIWPSIWKLEIKAFQFSVAWRHCQILFLGVSCLLHPKDLWCDVNIYIYLLSCYFNSDYSCWSDEDFVGRIARLSRSCHPSTCCFRSFQKALGLYNGLLRNLARKSSGWKKKTSTMRLLRPPADQEILI